MAWFTRFTRFGDAHIVYSQEAENSCGIACVIMVVFKMHKLSPGKQAVYKETEVYKLYDEQRKKFPAIWDGIPYDGSAYSWSGVLAATLNQLDVGRWETKDVGAAGVSQAIIDSVGQDYVGLGPLINGARRGDPIIVLTDWIVGGGAHFVCIDTVNNFFGTTYASVCDPWDGDVHIQAFEAGKTFEYLADKPRLSWDTGGTRHEYAAAKKGEFRGWIVHKVG